MQIRRIVMSLIAALSFSALALAQSDGGEMIDTPEPTEPSALTMQTGDLSLLPRGTMRFNWGSSYGSDFCQPYTGLCGNLWRHGVIRLNLGLANNVNLQLDGALYQQLDIDAAKSLPAFTPVPGSGNTHDIGDFSLAMLWRTLRERAGGRPALGFKFGVKLPNTNENKGIGTNTTDFFASGLLTKHWGDRATLTADLGFAILGQPQAGVSQNDVLTYGLAGSFKLTDRFRLWSEIAGRTATGGKHFPGTEDRGNATLGFLWGGKGGWHAELTGSHGIYSSDPDWTLGLAFSIQGRVLKRLYRSN
jgi:hypothetical protein